jgi:transposase
MIVYIGIDWSKEKHDIGFMNEEGGQIAHMTIPHSPKGFERFDAQRAKLGQEPGACIVGIETHHNLFLDYLGAHGYRNIYVLSPFMVSRTRGRYRASGASDDQRDAYMLADILRTDRHRLSHWQPNKPLTQQIVSRVSLQRYLTGSITQITNRLRMVLWQYYPHAADVFSKLSAKITLRFICAYPTPGDAVQLTYEEFYNFARQHGYPNPKKLPGRFVRLQHPQPQADPVTVAAFQDEAVRLAKLALCLVQERETTEREIKKLFAAHPDAAIFSSLPGAGDKLAPALLAKFGDNRQRFPSAQVLQATAGTSPYTKKSGKRKYVRFRRACDREFRGIVHLWARASLDQSVWANSYYQQVRPGCNSTSHALRCLGNRWLAIAWRIWQDRVPYDEHVHLKRRALRARPL